MLGMLARGLSFFLRASPRLPSPTPLPYFLGGRAYPAETHPEVVILIDNAPWHQGPIVEEAMAAHPHLTFYRLPSYSPPLNPIARCWRILRRRATHNRLFTTRSELR